MAAEQKGNDTHEVSGSLPMEATSAELTALKGKVDIVVQQLEELNGKVAHLKTITADGFTELAMGGDQLHPKGSFKNPGVSCPEIKAS